jgi:hypothetical protein
MCKSAETIVKEIKSHISDCPGKYYSDFYVGICINPFDRLFNDHNVDKDNGYWIYLEAKDIANARSAENKLLGTGMKGGDGGGHDTSVYVYCYQLSNNTTAIDF